MNFPKYFIWGTASSSYQIEGAAGADGKGVSIWDTFSHQDGKIAYGHTGDISCDHYHRYKEDIDIMAQMDLQAYRFSISWPRLFPNGDTVRNEKGFAFYDKLVDYLLQKNITPYLTLYHWDLPQKLQDSGGWTSRDTTDAFAFYAREVVKHFSGRIKHFITFNEPQVITCLGHIKGSHAPGLRLKEREAMRVMHNLALAHGKAVLSMRDAANGEIQIGAVSTGKVCYPATNSSLDSMASKAEMFHATSEDWFFTHHWFLDAVCFGCYPELNYKNAEKKLSFIEPDDFTIIKQPLDFLGFNIYHGHEITTANPSLYMPKYEGFPRTALKWPITPKCLHYGLRYLYDRYHLPIYITENGISCNDKVYLDGQVHDPDRIDYLNRYLMEMEKVFAEGIDLRGYFHWSFTDNFEWNNGYEERFGLIYVDYPTQRRIIKDSGYWYAKVIKTNGSSLKLPPYRKYGKLSLNGNTLCDKNGSPVVLRGISTHGIQHYPQYINYHTFKTLRDDWGIDIIRLAMYTDPIIENYTPGLKDLIIHGVELATGLGLYVVIDWHILSDGNPNLYKEEAITFFEEMSLRFSEYDNIFYEICNEPNGDVQWQRDITPYARELISVIRNHHKDAIILTGTPTWSQDVDIACESPLSETHNIMYVLHYYAATHKEELRKKLIYAHKKRLPVFVSEFGICDASGNGIIDLEEADKWISLLESLNISYICWNLSNKDESSALLTKDSRRLWDWKDEDISSEGKWFVETVKKYS